MKSELYSERIKELNESMIKLHKKFAQFCDSMTMNWKDERQKEFSSKYLNFAKETMSESMHTISMFEIKIRSIEAELKNS
jgi:hypothetical protein